MIFRALMVGLFLVGFVVSASGADVFDQIKKAEQVLKGDKPGKAKAAGQEEGNKDAGAAPAGSARSSGKHPSARSAKGREYPPGLSFSTVLNGVLCHSQKGLLTLHHIQATFLPEDGREGYAILRKADGKEIYKIEWKSQTLEKPYFLLDFWKVIDAASGKQTEGDRMDLKEPGDYVLDFYTKSEFFYTYPFSVAKLSGDDPFGDGSFVVLNGDWSNWAYLYYARADASQSLQWKVWLRVQEPVKSKDVKPKIEITRDSDNQLVCVSREITLTLKPEWFRAEFDMIFPPKGTSGGAYFKAKDLLGTDGNYTLTMKLDDKPYGTWKFTINDGKPQLRGRAARGKADPLTFIEGGRDAFWYCKEEAKGPAGK